MSAVRTNAHHLQRVNRMVHDPDCCGDLLLLGIAMARAVDLGNPPIVHNTLRIDTIATQIYDAGVNPDAGGYRVDRRIYRAQNALWADRPRAGASPHAANAGGVLERHLPEINWWRHWRLLDPTWMPPPGLPPNRRGQIRILMNPDMPDPEGRIPVDLLLPGREARNPITNEE